MVASRQPQLWEGLVARRANTTAAFTEESRESRPTKEEQKAAASSPTIAAQQTVERAQHQSGKATQVAYTLPHPIWQNEYVDGVQVHHVEPENLTDKLALLTVRAMRCVYSSAISVLHCLKANRSSHSLRACVSCRVVS
jgi:hypothetical protein